MARDEEAQTPRLRLHLLVRGRVQGVGFRAWAAQAANDLGLCGYVMNRGTGDLVEAEVEGDPTAVRRFAQILHHGPPLADVRSVQSRAVPVRHAHSTVVPPFVIRR